MEGNNIFIIPETEGKKKEKEKKNNKENQNQNPNQNNENSEKINVEKKYFFLRPNVSSSIKEKYHFKQFQANIKDNDIPLRRLIPFVFKGHHDNTGSSNIYTSNDVEIFEKNIHSILSAANLLDPAGSSPVFEDNFNFKKLFDNPNPDIKKLGIIQHLLNLN